MIIFCVCLSKNDLGIKLCEYNVSSVDEASVKRLC